jgi:hypothetical protein
MPSLSAQRRSASQPRRSRPSRRLRSGCSAQRKSAPEGLCPHSTSQDVSRRFPDCRPCAPALRNAWSHVPEAVRRRPTRRMTRFTSVPRDFSSSSRACAWPTVRGKPSKMNPAAPWFSGQLFVDQGDHDLVGDEAAFVHDLRNRWPSSEPDARAARSMSPVESWMKPRSSTNRFACVPFPAAGGPNSIKFISCGPRASTS